MADREISDGRRRTRAHATTDSMEVTTADGAPPPTKQLRVVSVLPSATEMLCFIGGGHLLVGRSHEDNYPVSITHLPVVTGQLTVKEKVAVAGAHTP